MRSSVHPAHAYPHSTLAALIVRSHSNIERSRGLVASASALVRTTRRIRRPRIAGGSEALADSPRALRTWARVKEGGLPLNGVRWRWVGSGGGERCNGCGDGIDAREAEFQVDFSDALLLRFHRECFKTWQRFEAERR